MGAEPSGARYVQGHRCCCGVWFRVAGLGEIPGKRSFGRVMSLRKARRHEKPLKPRFPLWMRCRTTALRSLITTPAWRRL